MQVIPSREKSIRRFQVLALCLAEPGRTAREIAKRLEWSLPTIKHDIKNLRKEGYEINVVDEGGGYSVDEFEANKIIQDFCRLHFLIDLPSEDQENEYYDADSLGVLIYVWQCIRKTLCLTIKLSKGEVTTIEPITVLALPDLNGCNRLRIISWYNKEVKQFFLVRVREYSTNTQKYDVKHFPRSLIADSSLMVWCGTPGEKVKLKVSGQWERFDSLRRLLSVEDEDKDELIWETTSGSLEMTSRWIVAQKGAVVAVEPEELCQRVISTVRSLAHHPPVSSVVP